MSDLTTASTSSRRWISLAASCAAAGMVWLAFADLGVAIPTIADEFQADLSTLQWANNAFSLVTGALVIAAGRFGDIFGQRRVLLIGVVLFAAFSVVAAMAPGVDVLIAGRALMGVGAAAILPATLALIPVQFSGSSQLAAFGTWQAVAWGGQAIGPAVGGLITDWLGWQFLFWINLPIAAVALVVIRAATPEVKDAEADRRIDWAGVVTIGLAVFALLYALTDGPAVGWSDPLVVTLLVAAVVLALGWVWIERKVAAPLVDLRLFGLRAYDGALVANLTMNLAFAGASYLLVLWLQNARGYDPVEAGMLMLPATVGIFAFIGVGGKLQVRHGGRMPVLVGLLIMSVGLACLGWVSGDSSLVLLAVPLVIMGVGLGLLSTPVSDTAVGQVPAELAGTAAGVFKMSSMVGGALGVAVLSAFARGFVEDDVRAAADAAGMDADDIEQAHRALVNSASFHDALTLLPPRLREEVTQAAVEAFSLGVADTMVVTAVIGVIATVVVWFLWPRRERGPSSPQVG